MRWEERAALQAAAQIEAHERAQAEAKQTQRVQGMRQLMFEAIPAARDGGISNTELSDAWSLPRHMIRDKMDAIHKERRYQR